jgi:hypothetical protein
MKKSVKLILSSVIALTSLSSLTANAATSPQLTVDLSNQYRTVTHLASGSLYGLSHQGWPADSLIAPTKPRMFTQMAPGGQQIPNTGDALVVAPIAARYGAQVTIRMPDIYPNFPYRWVSWPDWYSKVDTIVQKTVASGASNIYGYELWNEPDWTWDTANAGTFNSFWKNTYDRIRAVDKTTKIIGPSIEHYDYNWLRDFLVNAKANNALPDIISWHELGNPEGNHIDNPKPWNIQAHITEYRALEASLGISPRPISINEFASINEEGVPGSVVRYFAQFERNGVDTATEAFWFRPGRLSNTITFDGQANGGWWLNKWYGDMSGMMAMTTPAVTNALGLDGIASIDSSNQTVHVVYGGADGDNTVVVKGFANAPFFGNSVHVKAEMTPWYGVDTAVSAPTTIFEGDFAITGGQISLPIANMDKSYGYHLIITPTGANNTRYEAEKATVNQATVYSNSNASNGSYVGGINNSGSYVQFNVNVAAAGTYNMEIRYANGGTAGSTNLLSVNGGSSSTITYPVTGGWLSTGSNGTVKASVNLNAGSNTIQLAKGTNYAEIDYIQLTPVQPFGLRLEAEKATVNHAVVDTSSYTSGQYFVGGIDYADSYVQFTAVVPTAGTYNMDIGYANGTSGHSTQLLSINGGAASTLTYGSTGNWSKHMPNYGARRIKSVPVTLHAGSNTIRLTHGGTGYAELDYIELYQGAARYEAENAMVNHSIVHSNASVSGGSYVGGIDYNDSYVQFNVNVPTAGTYKVKIAYGNGQAQPYSGSIFSSHNLSVNGGANKTVSYAPTEGWLGTRAAWISTITVNLNAGANTLRFSNSGNGYAELDYIDVSK